VADEQDKSQQTEEPTQKKMDDARKKGQVPTSKEHSSAVTYIVISIIGFTGISTWMGESLITLFGSYLSGGNSVDLTDDGLRNLMVDALYFILLMILPIGLPIVLFSMLITMVISGPVFTFETMKPKFEKISPKKGIERLFSTKSLAEFIKSLLKLTAITTACWYVFDDLLFKSIKLVESTPMQLSAFTVEGVTKMAMISAALFAAISLIDIVYQKWEWTKGLRMSQKEIKDEYKEMEGDPQMKGKIKQIQAEMAQQRMMSDVPKADVIITNPTHFAVAIKYDTMSQGAPKVIAKGKDSVALNIKEIAINNNVPIRENRPLARSLFSLVKIGGEVPEELYEAVAIILAEILQNNN